MQATRPNPLASLFLLFIPLMLLSAACSRPLGEQEAIRVYVEFADGTHRGMFDPATGTGGYPDEDFDATTAMVINWHKMPEQEAEHNALLEYRKIHPAESRWRRTTGDTYEFWHREELINRVVLTGLDPGSVYEFRVSEDGGLFRFSTMPASLEERPVTIVFTSDHQSPSWNQYAHRNAELVAARKPDMFVVAGDFVNCEGVVSPRNAERWALYLDNLYGVNDGYFIFDREFDGIRFENLILPHVGILGNHETGQQHHTRWPADLYTGSTGYPQYVAANWMQLLFHWPFSSEGFYSEFNPDHPNMDPEQVREGYGKGGFGKLSFGDYLLLVGLDTSQNFEAPPEPGLRDWEGRPITDRWPWFETVHGEVRQDLWLKHLMEPDNGPAAGERYRHIIPVTHRGLYGTVRMNMTYKNRSILRHWMPLFHRSGVKLYVEGHDHIYTRTVPLNATEVQPENTTLSSIRYEPTGWTLSGELPQEYLDDFHSINVLLNNGSEEIVGWEFEGTYTTRDPQGMIIQGHGGWAAGRRTPGDRGGGNAGTWFVEEAAGGASFGGDESFHTTTVTLTGRDLTVRSDHPFGGEVPMHHARWDMEQEKWFVRDYESPEGDVWVPYEEYYPAIREW